MSKVRYCFYHPVTEAGTFCRQCGTCFCKTCLSGHDEDALCPRCRFHLVHVDAYGIIPPFWEQLSDFYRWPWRGVGSALILLMGALAVLPLPTLFAWVVPALALLIGAAFAGPLLFTIARGRIAGPLVRNPFQPIYLRLTVRVVALVCMVAVPTAAAWFQFGLLAGLLVLAITLLVGQGGLVILSRRASLDKALGPDNLSNLMRALGKVYVLLWLYELSVVVGGVALLGWLAQVLPIWLWQGLSSILVVNVVLALACTLGYVSLQYREIELFNDNEEVPGGPLRGRERQVVIPADQRLQGVLIDMALKDGDFDAVESRLKQQVLAKNGREEKPALDRWIRLVSERNDWGKLEPVKVPALRSMLDAMQDREICAFLKHCLTANPEFELNDGELLFRVSRTLYFNGEYRLLLRLLHQLETRLPGNPRVVDSLLLVACALANGLKNADKARAYLKHVQKAYPDHPATAELVQWLLRLETTGRLPEPSTAFKVAAA